MVPTAASATAATARSRHERPVRTISLGVRVGWSARSEDGDVSGMRAIRSMNPGDRSVGAREASQVLRRLSSF
jgi:hypothetical protein